MPDYHLRRTGKVEDVFLAKEAMHATNGMEDQQDMDLPNHSKDEILYRIDPVKKSILTLTEDQVSKDANPTALNDNHVIGRTKQVSSEVHPVFKKPSSEFLLFAKIKNICSSLAFYLASFWIVRASLTLNHNCFALMENIAEIIDAPVAESFSFMRRILQSILDFHVDSELGRAFPIESTEIDEADQNLEEVLRKSSNIVFKEIEPKQKKTYEKRMEDIDELDGSNNICNAYNDDILEECSEDIQDYFTQLEEISTVKELSSISRLKTISSSSDELVLFCNVGTDNAKMEDEPFEKVTMQTEEEADAIINTEDSKPFAYMTPYDFCVENVDGFLGTPPTAPSTAERYPRFQHMNISQPYQNRYNKPWRSVSFNVVKQDMVGPKLSSAGSTSCIIPDKTKD